MSSSNMIPTVNYESSAPLGVFHIKPRKQYTIQRKREKWTKEEHKKFIEAIEKFGRNWKKVEDHIKTKTRKQIRSHAQKHFDKLKKMGVNFPPPRAKRKAQHPYPSRKTTELYAMYTRAQQQLQQLQMQQIHHLQFPQLEFQIYQKQSEDEPAPNFDKIFNFLGTLITPQKFPNQEDFIAPLGSVDKKYIHLLMHNLTVLMSTEPSSSVVGGAGGSFVDEESYQVSMEEDVYDADYCDNVQIQEPQQPVETPSSHLHNTTVVVSPQPPEDDDEDAFCASLPSLNNSVFLLADDSATSSSCVASTSASFFDNFDPSCADEDDLPVHSEDAIDHEDDGPFIKVEVESMSAC